MTYETIDATATKINKDCLVSIVVEECSTFCNSRVKLKCDGVKLRNQARPYPREKVSFYNLPNAIVSMASSASL